MIHRAVIVSSVSRSENIFLTWKLQSSPLQWDETIVLISEDLVSLINSQILVDYVYS